MPSILRKSLQASLRSAALILKLVIPLYMLADLLLYFDLLRYISFLFEPVTSFLQLPAEAAMALAGGMLINLYAAVAFAAPLGLTPYQWTVLAIFLGVCHSLIVESAIMRKLGIAYFYTIPLRIGMAFITVLPLMLIPREFFGTAVEASSHTLQTYPSFAAMLLASLRKSSLLAIKIILLISVIIFIMDLVKSTKWMQAYAQKVNTSFSVIVGQMLGITYGAGVLINEAKSSSLNREEILFVATFLMVSHSVLEDALLFVIFGANYWLIVGIRLVMAFIVSYLLSRLMRMIPSLSEKLTFPQ